MLAMYTIHLFAVESGHGMAEEKMVISIDFFQTMPGVHTLVEHYHRLRYPMKY